MSALYRQREWGGFAPPDELVEPERVGLLTRGAFVASGSATTRPVIKGYHIRNAFLCQAIPPPPANAKAVPPDLSPDLTTREVIERLTQQPGTACLGCHGSLLNAIQAGAMADAPLSQQMLQPVLRPEFLTRTMQ